MGGGATVLMKDNLGSGEGFGCQERLSRPKDRKTGYCQRVFSLPHSFVGEMQYVGALESESEAWGVVGFKPHRF